MQGDRAIQGPSVHRKSDRAPIPKASHCSGALLGELAEIKEPVSYTHLDVYKRQNLIRYNTATNSVRSEYVNLDEFLLEMRLRPAEI